MSQHAKLSPSSAHRWVRCAGSVRMEEAWMREHPDEGEETEPQKYGTCMHQVLELCLQQNRNARSYVDKHEYGGVAFDGEMAEWVDEALLWVTNYRKTHKGTTLKSEERVTMSEQIWGTADVLIWGPTELVVGDLKGGMGWVDVDENYQLVIYALGAVSEYENKGMAVKNLRLIIWQPRHGGTKELIISREDLEGYRKFINAKAKATEDRNAPLVASEEACSWCKVRGVCPEAQKLSLALARQEEWPDVLQTIDEKQFLQILDKASFVRKLLEAAEKVAVERLLSGGKVDGFKIVESRKHRKWKDDKQAAETLRKNGVNPYKEKLITPAEAERNGTTAVLIEKLSIKPEGEPTLARADDPRPSLKLKLGA